MSSRSARISSFTFVWVSAARMLSGLPMVASIRPWSISMMRLSASPMPVARIFTSLSGVRPSFDKARRKIGGRADTAGADNFAAQIGHAGVGDEFIGRAAEAADDHHGQAAPGRDDGRQTRAADNIHFAAHQRANRRVARRNID